MAVQFNGVELFGSGPMRTQVSPTGQQVRLLADAGSSQSGYSSLGALALSVVVRGRIIEAEGESLEEKLTSIDNLARDTGSTADLVCDDAGSFAGVNLVKFTRTGPVDLGRVRSVGFEAQFVRLPR